LNNSAFFFPGRHACLKDGTLKNPNIRPETLKPVQKRAGNTLELRGTGNSFLTTTPMAQQLRERIDKWHCMKCKVSAQQRKWSPD
jgi:hypothetical protein